MPIYGQHNGMPPSSGDEDMTVGYATNEGLHLDFMVNLALFIFIALITIGIGNTVFITIQEAIKPREVKKPKLYYHYWSAVVLTIATMCVIFIDKFELIYINSFAVPLLLALGIVCVKDSKTLTVPLTILIPTNPCKFIWTYIVTIIGLSSTLTFISYLIYALPTIIFMYHLHPIRTLIKIPFVIGAISITVALGSVVYTSWRKSLSCMWSWDARN